MALAWHPQLEIELSVCKREGRSHQELRTSVNTVGLQRSGSLPAYAWASQVLCASVSPPTRRSCGPPTSLPCGGKRVSYRRGRGFCIPGLGMGWTLPATQAELLHRPLEGGEEEPAGVLCRQGAGQELEDKGLGSLPLLLSQDPQGGRQADKDCSRRSPAEHLESIPLWSKPPTPFHCACGLLPLNRSSPLSGGHLD